MPARDKQIGERAGHEPAMSVLFEPAIAHLGEAEDPLDDPDRMLDFGPHLRFGPVCRALDLVHDAAMAVAAIGEVPRLGCVLANIIESIPDWMINLGQDWSIIDSD